MVVEFSMGDCCGVSLESAAGTVGREGGGEEVLCEVCSGGSGWACGSCEVCEDVVMLFEDEGMGVSVDGV